MKRYTGRYGIPLLIAVLLALTACQPSDSAAPEERTPEEFVYGLTLVPSGLDPHIHASSELGIPLRSVYDTLVYRDADTLEFVPGLAETWVVSPDGLTYTFTLRQDVKFHDDTPFNAEAARINLDRIRDPETGSMKAAQLLGPVQSVQATGEYELTVTLAEPFAPLLDGLSQPYTGMASPAALAEHGLQNYQFHQVGTGPYRFIEYKFDDYILLERNPDYAWPPATVANPGIPTVEHIYFRFYSDVVARGLALESGEADIMGELTPTDARRLSSTGSVRLEEVNVAGQPVQFMFNTQKFPTDSLAFRQALLYATDRQTIVSTVYQGYSPIAFGPITSSTLFYNPNVEGLYTHDPVQAEALANTTGWVDSDGDGKRDRDGEPVVVQIVTPPWSMAPDVATLLEAQWEETLNIEVQVRQVGSFPLLSEAAAGGDYNAISLHFAGLDPSVMDAFYRSNGPRNWARVSDPELDQLLDRGVIEQNSDLRRDIYAEIQQRIMDQALILPVRETVNVNGYQPGISGLHFDAYGWFPYLTDIGFGS